MSFRKPLLVDIVAIVVIVVALAFGMPARAHSAQEPPGYARINDAMQATYGVRLPILVTRLPAPITAQLEWRPSLVIRIVPRVSAATERLRCQVIAHEYTHYVRRDGEAYPPGTGPSTPPDQMQAAYHANWPQVNGYPACARFGAKPVRSKRCYRSLVHRTLSRFMKLKHCRWVLRVG